MMKFIKKEIEDYKHLLRAIPSLTVSLFVVSVILMNLLANKEIQTGLSWLALDCGLLVSWLSFLSMDVITKRFGAKASTKISILAIGVNLIVCFMLFLISNISGNWGEFYTYENPIVNSALDATFGGTWYILMGSTIALLISSATNNFVNSAIGKLFKSNSFTAYATRSYVSTMVGQFLDNLLFSLIVSHHFFGWSLLQCVTCSLTGALVELLCEVIFSPLGYKICKGWERENVGKDYLHRTFK